jgi:glycosyltransferase involved in cell wall biosynthesis
MKPVPRVSILLPTYNRPEYLRECVTAALGSTFEDIEVVIGDDGGLARAVFEAVDDARLRYVLNPRRLGMAGNWTALLNDARGDLLALCMDDDRLDARFVETCTRAFDIGGSDLGVVFTNHSIVDDAGNERIRQTATPPGRHKDFARTFMLEQSVCVSAAMFTRAAWEAVRPLPDTAAADMVLFGRLAEMGLAFEYVDIPLMRYRSHPAQLSGERGFRSDRIAAWSDLRFSDAVAENARLRKLGEALVARASLHLQEGKRAEARADLRMAHSLAAVSLRQLALVGAAAIFPTGAIGAATRLRRRWRAL